MGRRTLGTSALSVPFLREGAENFLTLCAGFLLQKEVIWPKCPAWEGSVGNSPRVGMVHYAWQGGLDEVANP